MSRFTLLRGALAANAVFSLASALVLILAPGWIREATGLPAGPTLPIVGASLLLWAAFVGREGLRASPSTLRALIASQGDLLWVVGTAVGLAVRGDALTSFGVTAVVGVAGVVGVLGVAQLVGIRRVHADRDPARPTSWRHCVSVEVDVAPNRMWAVVSDLGAIADFAPDLARSEADGPLRVGTTRRCADGGGRSWEETCTAVEPGRSFTLRFGTEADDFPFPVDAMVGGWIVEPAGEGSRVSVWWSFDPSPSWAALLLVPLAAREQDRQIRGIVSRMAAVARGEPAGAARERTARLVAAC